MPYLVYCPIPSLLCLYSYLVSYTLLLQQTTALPYTTAQFQYRIAGMFGGGKVWRITSSKVVGEKKFGECLTAALRRRLLLLCTYHMYSSRELQLNSLA